MYKKLIIFLFLFVFSCKEEPYKFKPVLLQEQITFTELAPAYNIKNKQDTSDNIIIFKNTEKESSSMGMLFYFTSDKAINIKSIKIETKEKQKFKLYLNGIFFGKFTNDQSININKKIYRLNILFLKPEKERLIRAWKDDTIIVSVNARTFGFQPKIVIRTPLKDSTTRFHIKKLRNSTVYKRNNKKFIKKYLKKGILTSNGMLYKKSGKQKIQYSICIHDKNTISIYQLISDKKEKKVLQEVLFTGKWNCIRLSQNSLNLILKGKLNGYFRKKSNKLLTNKKINFQLRIKNNIIYFDKIFKPVCINFPDDALVNVHDLIPSVQIALAYATKQNFTKTKLYPCNKCFIRYKVAKALLKVQNELQEKEMSLKFFDCYRPYHVQKLMFEKFPVKGYVASPVGGSIHNRGLAVDLTIIDHTGKELDMGTKYDSFSPKARHSYLDLPDTILQNRLLLKNIMIKYGFSPIRSEWWHYNYRQTHQFPVIDDEFLCD